MRDLFIHYSLLDAEEGDFAPIYGDDDESSLIPCVDVFYDTGVVELVHTGMSRPFVVTPDYVRFDARGPLDVLSLKSSLQPGQPLCVALAALCAAANDDTGLLAACDRMSELLEAFRGNDA